MATTVTLNVSNLVNDAGARFLYEASEGQPAPPAGMIKQAINEAYSDLLYRLDEFISGTSGTTDSTSDALDSEQTTFSFTLSMTTRRLGHKNKALAQAAHAFMIDNALYRMYNNMHRTDLANTHFQMYTNDLQVLEQLLYSRTEPSY